MKLNCKVGLLASTSLVALAMGAGAPAWAGNACNPSINMASTVASVSNSSASATCIDIEGSGVTITGNVTNQAGGILAATGTNAPSATGIFINSASVLGAVINSGTINSNHNGIIVSGINAFVSQGITNAGSITASGDIGIGVANGSVVSTFSGGIFNSGTIQAFIGILVGIGGRVSTFVGGITNSGTIESGLVGIGVGITGAVSTFSGGISNSGMIVASFGDGIAVGDFGGTVTSFIGGITNSGTIVASSGGSVGIGVGFSGTVTSFIGGITNSGMIVASATSSAGIAVGFSGAVSTFMGGITNGGMIVASSANSSGIAVGVLSGTVSIFSGGITNGGTISAGQSGIALGASAGVVSTFSGGITNSGMIVASSANSAGIAIGATNGTVSAFSGGITNAGTISAGQFGIGVGVGRTIDMQILSGTVFAFSGGITNSGMIVTTSTMAAGIAVGFEGTVSTFSGGISNSGTIGSGLIGIVVGVEGTVSAFSGGIVNSGTIESMVVGIAVGLVGTVSTFSGGITNSGLIVASSSNSFGISVGGLNGTVPTFSGPIVNSGTISAGQFGIAVGAGGTVSTFTGGISNSGLIVATSPAHAGGIAVGVEGTVSTFSGNIVNSGTISSAFSGITVLNAESFLGGITNSGTIIAKFGINVAVTSKSLPGPSFFNGNIVNSGSIASTGTAIFVNGVSTFSGSISNSGTISSLVGVFVENVGTFTGGITNSGKIIANTGIVVGAQVTFAPGSAIVNSGTIIGSVAAIDVSAATSPVIIDQVGGSISGAINLGSTIANTLSVSGGIINGSIVGSASTLNLSGGLVLLSGTNTIGAATMSGGMLEIGDASHTSTTLTLVNNQTLDVTGGTLAGHGTLIGNAIVENGAILMPGGSVGNLTINGNLTLQSGSTFLVQLSPTQNSQTNVNGNVTINGAKVVLDVPVGTFRAGAFTIITASGTTTGSFNPVIGFENSFGLIDPFALFGTQSIVITDQGAGFILPANAPINAQNAVGAINAALNAGNNLPSSFSNLANLSGNALITAANQLAGQSQGSAAPVGFHAGDMFLRLMLDPYAGGRSTLPIGSAPLAYAGDPPKAPAADAFSALSPNAIFAPGMAFWTAAYGSSGTIQGNGVTGAASANSQIYGAATGLDYRINPDMIVGLALGGGGTAWQLDQGLGNGHSGMFQAGVYATGHSGPAYVSAAAAYSLQDVTTTRTVTLDGFDALQGRFDAHVFSGRIEGGYRMAYNGVGVTPYGAAQIQAMVLPGYSEFATTGSSQFALSYNAQTSFDTRTELGFWFDTDKVAPSLSGSGLTLYSRVAWAHDFQTDGTSTASFQSLPGTSFVVNTVKPANDGGLITAGFNYRLGGGWSVESRFDGEFSNTTSIFTGTAALHYIW